MMEEYDSYNGQFRDGDRVFVDKPLPDIIAAENNAVASIVLGCVSMVLSSFVIGFILGIVAIVTGGKARNVLNERHHKFHIALVGKILGWVSIGLSIVMAFYWIFYFAYMSALLSRI